MQGKGACQSAFDSAMSPWAPSIHRTRFLEQTATTLCAGDLEKLIVSPFTFQCPASVHYASCVAASGEDQAISLHCLNEV